MGITVLQLWDWSTRALQHYGISIPVPELQNGNALRRQKVLSLFQPPCRVNGLILTLLPFVCIIGIPGDNISFKYTLFFQTKSFIIPFTQGTIAVQWATVVIFSNVRIWRYWMCSVIMWVCTCIVVV